MLRAFPMILIAVLVYNATVFGGQAAGQHDMVALLARKFSVAVYSGDVWPVSISDLFLSLTLLLLFVEVIQAVRAAIRQTVNHVLAILTFLAAAAEFVLLKGFGNSTFFFIMAMALFDVTAGYAIAIVAARQDVRPPPEHDYD